MRKTLNPLTLYLILSFSSSLLFSAIFTVNMLYQVTIARLDPLQLVLVGTTLEITVFLFEVPTGVVADIKSRRLSIIIGYVIMGLGFMLEGSLPIFWTIALAQGFWGLGYTFTSGATQAWIADEVGEDRAGPAFLRGSQAGQLGGLVGIPISVALALGGGSVALPIVLCGAALILLACLLILTMSEEGFTPAAASDRTTWGSMLKTVRDARLLVQRQPVLLMLLGIWLFYGLYSEGFDRLWTAHLLEDFAAPAGLTAVDPVVWFGAIRAVLLLISLAAVEVARRRVDTSRAAPIAWTLMLCAGLIVAALAGFALTGQFWIALALYWLVGTLRSVTYPLYDAWFNQRIDDPQVRATMFSVGSQVDAIGQIGGGPIVGAIGSAVSIRAALFTSALILSPVVPLYALAIRRGNRRGNRTSPDRPADGAA
ncbi:MAG: MFS transporter [Chloroflexi bacterium]|nr:MFS transporter [Chloroflexota bacterium]MBU1749027.1 MFS transporter [Chloroflexota bacterium]MBU1878559.1 MFS transporter [Chloroflexota bacterium]